MSRNTPLLIAVASVLLAQRALAVGVSVAMPQTGGTTTTISTSQARRCASCATSAERRAHQRLLMKIDSIRWEIENRRMTDDERERAATELFATVRELQRALDEGQNFEATIVRTPRPAPAPGAAVAAGAVAAATPYAVALRNPTRGWIGVTFEGLSSESRTSSDHRVRFFDYPRIALVEPSSPADRAGVLRGDTVLALNGTDVMSEVISFTKLLVPESQIVMRIRRGGSAKDLKVVVGEPPEYYARRREPGAYGGARVEVAGTPEPARPIQSEPNRVIVMPARPEGVPGVSGFRYWTEFQAMAGASFETVTEAWAKALRVDDGVLVTRAPPGSPAHRSGLREGDVIVRAAGDKIRTVSNLRTVLAEGDGTEGVKLVILRERKERDITLRWER
jgi:hypothetical protein